MITKTLAANSSGSPRVDLVVLRLNRSTWTVTVQVVQGTPGAGAPAATRTPSTGGGTIYEIELATVTVAAGATTLAGSTVTDKAWYLNEDGQILCESDRRPPHHPGRSAFETDTGRWILSDGTNWRNAVDDSGILAVAMLTGFSATENNLQRRGGLCVLNIKVQRTNAAIPAGSTTKVGNLPAGCAPTFPVQSASLYWAGGQPAGLRVTSSGLYVVTPAGVTVAEDRTVDGSLVWHGA